jgi:hypothetical protein
MLELTGGSVMHQGGRYPGFVVHDTTLCSMHVQCPTFIPVSVQMENLGRVPKMYWNRKYGITTIYACGSVTIYPVQTVLSYPRTESCEINSLRNALLKTEFLLNNI